MLAGSTMFWSSKKQESIALLSTEAEYIATAHAAKEIIWLQWLLIDLLQHITSPTSLRIDNQSAIAIAKNPKFHDHTKHIKVHHHFLGLKVEQQEISLNYIPTNAQPADTLTKGLAKDKHDHFVSVVGVYHAMWEGMWEDQYALGIPTGPDAQYFVLLLLPIFLLSESNCLTCLLVI
jgi:hypothetical protein